jgi:DNA/RNA-binding domain of Phe-tRNA-synthetase-like protein
MTALVVHEDAAELGIRHPVACVIRNVRVADADGVLDGEIDRLVETLRTAPETILERPEVRGFDELFARMGYRKQTPAGRRLVEGFQKRGFKRYGNLIDAYNLASAWFGSGLGMHDASLLTGDVHVFRATGHEQIVPLFKTEPVGVVRGDLVYGEGEGDGEAGGGGRLLAWLGQRDVDSDAHKVQDGTTSLLLVALGNAATPEDYNRGVCLKAVELIQRTCPEATAGFLETRPADR